LLAATAFLLAAFAPSAFATTDGAAEGGAAQVRLPGTFAGAYLAARIADSDNDRENASRLFTQALALSSEGNLPVKQSLLLTLVSQGDISGALGLAEELKDEPDIDRIARLVLGVEAMRAGRFADAVAAFTLDAPSDLDLLISGLMQAWADLGAGDAKGALARIAKLDGPPWFEPFKQIHTAYVAQAAGMAKEADAAFEKAYAEEGALQTAPDAYLAFLEAYAIHAARSGNAARAFEIVQKAEDIAPNRPMPGVIREAVKAGTAPDALFSTPAQGASEVLFSIAMAINRDGAEPFVERYLRLALTLTPDRDLTLYELGRLAERMGRVEDSVALFGAVPDASPLHRLAHLQEALGLTDLKREEEAKALLRAMIAEDPSEVRPYLALSGIFSQAKDFRSAATLLDEAVLAVSPANPDVWNLHYQKGIAHERLKEWEIAEPAFRKALELNPDNADILNYLGYSLIDQGLKLDEALDMVRKAVELEPDSGYIIDSLGWAFFRLGRFEEAVVELERAIAIMPGDPVINDHMGDAYWAVGRKLEARFMWNHALAGDPEPEEKLKIRTKIDNALREEAQAKAARVAAFEAEKAAVPAPQDAPAPGEKPAADAKGGTSG
jgi:tetratricopeptide (TPR) repeat protein